MVLHNLEGGWGDYLDPLYLFLLCAQCYRRWPVIATGCIIAGWLAICQPPSYYTTTLITRVAYITKVATLLADVLFLACKTWYDQCLITMDYVRTGKLVSF